MPDEWVSYPGVPWPDERPMGWADFDQLLAAGEDRLQYDFREYRNHGISNNALGLLWGGLITTGLTLTDTGRRRLEKEKAARRWCAADFTD